MQFPDSVLDDILDIAAGLAPSSFVNLLREQLSARHKLRKALKTSGLSMSAATSANIKTFYAVGAVFKRGGWETHPESWELQGIAEAASAMVTLLSWGLPGVDMVDLAPQLNSAYVNLSRRGQAQFQVAQDAQNFAEVYVFRDAASATEFKNNDLAKRRAASVPITGLVRK